ncbi:MULTISPECIES: recombinase family protein [Sandaracinus]|uniref:recombinase family protein n=1 Tax=Sandaracinus TaxID=1055688 RepID=UPI0019D4C2D2|nr:MULTISPECIES: recombinase family protein [Sandaracinus]QRN75826.1 Resolvase domain protein [Sandaracinus sp.]UJR87357.1 Resolvase [Sandaracinus amylolyticus]
MKKRAAIYLRVSRGEQSVENQRPAVMRVVRARKLKLAAATTYEESASAAKKRPAFERMMADAHGGAFDVLVVWSLDRFGRSMVGNLHAVLELDRCGVEVVSVREPWLDTGGPVRALLIAIFLRAGLGLVRPRPGSDRWPGISQRHVEGVPPRAISLQLGKSILADRLPGRAAHRDSRCQTPRSTHSFASSLRNWSRRLAGESGKPAALRLARLARRVSRRAPR